jgi:hypothetical protein
MTAGMRDADGSVRPSMIDKGVERDKSIALTKKMCKETQERWVGRWAG